MVIIRNIQEHILVLPVELEHVHNVFHISQLRMYIADLTHATITEPIEVTRDLVTKSSRSRYYIIRLNSYATRR